MLGRAFRPRILTDGPENEEKGGDEMPLIYEPKGKAREYSPRALNIYSGGCDHGCKYCYCKQISYGKWGKNPKPRDLEGLEKEACLETKQILLSFMADPYCQAEMTYRKTREALGILNVAKCSVAILTKGGTRCLEDLETFKKWPEKRIKVGATLTFASKNSSEEWEPGAASPKDRIEALKQLHLAGIKTWASIEPVIIPEESLEIIKAAIPFVDAFKVGHWNHDKRAHEINWKDFGMKAIEIIRAARRKLYVKNDLRPFFPPGYLSAEECRQDGLNLPPRPASPCREVGLRAPAGFLF